MFSAAITILFALSNVLRATGLQSNRGFAFSFTPRRHHTPTSKSTPCQSRLAAASHSSPELSTFENKDRVTIPPSRPPDVRHPLFRKTNAISRNMPVPHPEIWNQCFENTSSRNESREYSFWSLVAHNFLGRQHESPNRRIVTDVEVTFDDPSVGAKSLLEKCGLLSCQLRCEESNSSGKNNKSNRDCNSNRETARFLPEIDMKEKQTLHHLTTILSYYQSIISPHDKTPCRARIVSSLGSIGTKCPRWHADHVPVRLVMSL
eukprot:CCRYP_004132-RB/>CCRYP_004132-RB protein AED:0.30 eAED:0.30 QI:119/-1/1/1/-1/0/1/0/261